MSREFRSGMTFGEARRSARKRILPAPASSANASTRSARAQDALGRRRRPGLGRPFRGAQRLRSVRTSLAHRSTMRSALRSVRLAPSAPAPHVPHSLAPAPAVSYGCSVVGAQRRYSLAHEALAGVIPNDVDATTPEFQANVESMNALVGELDVLAEAVRLGGSAKARDRHVKKGKMLPRDRVQRLLDPHSPFLELSPFAAHECYPGESIPGASIITGIGRVSGVESMIVANDATSKGGSCAFDYR